MSNKLKLHIGLEHERVMFDSHNNVAYVKGCGQDVLPHDRMSCLAETRGHPDHQVSSAVLSFLNEQKRVDKSYSRARKYVLSDKEEVVSRSIALKCFEGDDKQAEECNFNLVRGCGLHIHFSLMHNGICSSVFNNQFIIRELQRVLDNNMRNWVRGKSHYRQLGMEGTIRIKDHGFEYRPVGWYNNDSTELLKIAQRAFDSVQGVVFDAQKFVESISRPVFTQMPFVHIMKDLVL